MALSVENDVYWSKLNIRPVLPDRAVYVEVS